MKKLKCHCGQVEAEINAPDNLKKFLKCNCSICKRKGAIISMVKNEDFNIIKGKDTVLSAEVLEDINKTHKAYPMPY